MENVLHSLMMKWIMQLLTKEGHTNFPNFPIVDNNPSAGINTYELVCTRVFGHLQRLLVPEV
ncbi:hypothetical protein [Chengkuizengella sediminis]|uniref:hypothetical protein n=1 Tax=Chengkuizengella sediminis TaxID=1885917 RepID=UPI00138A0E17|nr:hypothetical protein [Chengkuizengella sediminis]NDI37175.1 hypothetical protein [Chengkuizengella sediminis]